MLRAHARFFPRLPQGLCVQRRVCMSSSSVTSAIASTRPLYAILVDAENARHNTLEPILQEIERLGGKTAMKRVYGDFSNPSLSVWKNTALQLSFRPVHAFSYVSARCVCVGGVVSLSLGSIRYTKCFSSGTRVHSFLAP